MSVDSCPAFLTYILLFFLTFMFLSGKSQDYKYFYWPNFKYEQLFDLKNDPGEIYDLVKSNSTDPVHQKLKEMRKRFVELKKMAYSDLHIIL